MNEHLQKIIDLIQHSQHLGEEEKVFLLKSAKEADDEMGIVAFKLDQTEKVKRTTAILLEETLTELEQKRKAVELQNRELEFESSLERVRTVAMSMNKRDDMLVVCRTISNELESLNVKEIRNVQTAIIYESKGTYLNFEYYRLHDKTLITEVDYNAHELQQAFASQMLKGKEELFSTSIQGVELKNWYDYQRTTNQFADTYLETAPSLNYYWYSMGPVAVGLSTYLPLTENEIVLFKRFRNVFELAYRRFSDIEKATAQAREAQVELALERVRARTLAMHGSDELADVAKLLFTQVKELGINAWTTGFNIWNEDNSAYIDWITDPSGEFLSPYTINVSSHRSFQVVREARESGKDFFVSVLEGPEIRETYELLQSFANKGQFQNILDAGISFPSHQVNHFVFGAHVSLLFITFEPCPEAWDVFRRFGKVFEQTYARFLDLQKAEAQAKEAQIELALERVRARTMAMQTSDELTDVAEVLFQQVAGLGIKAWTTGFNIWTDDNNFYTDYITNPAGGFIEPYTVDASIIPIDVEISNAKKSGNDFFVIQEEGEALAATYRKLGAFGEKQFKGILESGFKFPSHQFNHFVFGSKVSMMFVTCEPVPEAHEIFKRFGKVFEQTYTRFLDLQKAEAQAREAQVQLALERVRARTMAMQHSDELAEVSFVLDTQVRSLGIHTRGCAFNIYGANDSTEWFSSQQGTMPTYKTPRDGLFLRYYQAGKNGAPLYIQEFAGEDCAAHYKYLCTLPVMGDALRAMIEAGGSFPAKQVDHVVYFKYGYVLFITLEPVPEAHEIFIRFTKVFEQTYTRFLDLQKAEAQSREAQIELGLERVRARAMAMQNSDELNALIGTMFVELTKLDLQLTRCVIMINDPQTNSSRWWMANAEAPETPMNFFVKYHEYPPYLAYLDGWRKRTLKWEYIIHGRIKKEWDDFIFSETELSLLPEFVIAGMRSPERVYLNASFNSFGNLTLASLEPLSNEHAEILLRFAKVFDLTYTRFNDLKQVEAQAMRAEHDLIEIKEARIKAENALIELKATQKQLIQSEKMASLGELTAGIAHEIQNPLNFVNNFSAVNTELIQELKTEATAGNMNEVLELANNISANEEKITHHGKRADGIVKGMLQHSQKSSGQKEPTDINALCNEYLRLSYHGFRAKNNSFNATIKTDFDPSIGEINIIPQDIGRVLLNILNNAFFVVDEKKKSGIKNYEPTVSVCTKKKNDTIKISITDNGNGMPQKILGKIFQPFFTTKPTGQGTGLGLSLSYDIIKAHGGEIKVETQEGENSTFIIQLKIIN